MNITEWMRLSSIPRRCNRDAAKTLAVESANKLPTIWGHLKDSY